MTNQDPPPVEPPPAKPRGCLFWALTIAAVSALVIGGGGYLGYRYAKHRLVMAYSDTAPLDLGAPVGSPAELGQLHGRLAAFVHALRNKNPVEPLVLTGEELTALVVTSPAFQKLGGGARFSIGEGEVFGELSIPLAEFGYADRWFNGSAKFKITLENGVLIATLDSASVKGDPVPEWIVARMRGENLAKELYKSPQNAALIARLESVEVGNGKITVVPRLKR